MAKPACRTTTGTMKKKSNKPTKTKSKMKKTMRFLSMAALALVGAMTVSCSSDDNIIEQPQQPETKNNVVTLTTTVGFDDAAGTTRALSSTGTKTFAAGETMALVYKNTGGSTVKVVSAALTDGNITDGGKSATFTFELTDPDKAQDVTYIYPAAMAKDDGSVNYDALSSQDGTLTSLAANLDFCTKSGAWNGDNLPTLTLENQLAILAITLKNSGGSSDITSSITGLTLSDGTNTYNVTREAVAGPIYVAIFPTADATITVTATAGTKNYTKTLTGKTYAKGNGYSVSWKMIQVATDLSTLTADYTAQDGDILTGTLGSNVKISIADGASVTLKDVTINGVNNTSYKWAGITCLGDATITLEGTNTVKGFDEDYPGIHVPEGKTLTINGTGSASITASSNGYGAGIGGGNGVACGNIVINGGTVTATGGDYAAGIGGGDNYLPCGNIVINGGTVTATGGYWGAGIGSSNNGSCGAITISGGTVTATGGTDGAGIGSGETGSCGAITISGGTVTATGIDGAAGIGGGSYNKTCGTITIKSTVTEVTATKGSYAPNSIGNGYKGSGISVDIATGANVTQN